DSNPQQQAPQAWTLPLSYSHQPTPHIVFRFAAESSRCVLSIGGFLGLSKQGRVCWTGETANAHESNPHHHPVFYHQPASFLPPARIVPDNSLGRAGGRGNPVVAEPRQAGG